VQEKIKVLVVDDSRYVISTISKSLESDRDIEVIGTAQDGIEAVEKIKRLDPDVVTMDVIMPSMDGLTALGHIMSECPTPVIMLSALTSEGAETTIKSLELGAVDFFLKPSALSPLGDNANNTTLIHKIKLAARQKNSKTGNSGRIGESTPLKQKIKVLVVDDSGFVRSIVSRQIGHDPDIEVIGAASNGLEALNKVKKLRPDVVTMDVVMPEMDGLTCLQHIISECPTPVVMLSALTGDGTDTAIKALELGAVDFYLKPSVMNPTGQDDTSNSLIQKIKLAAGTRSNGSVGASVLRRSRQQKQIDSSDEHIPTNKVLVIGASTGGPRALMQVVPFIPEDIPAPILIIQHMPPVFTRSLAERLNSASQIEVKEAKSRDEMKAGQALIAPGDYHMTVTKSNRVSLNQEPPEQGVRPSVNVTMRSVAATYGPISFGVVLTGMGSDGTDGARRIKAAGGKIIVEDESTAAIYGMPKSIVDAGYADKMVPLHKIASEISEICSEEKTAKPR
jgi:two-component system chemotaxis response regulator CheB